MDEAEKIETPFKKGDKVRVIKYGHLMYMSKRFDIPRAWPLVFEDSGMRWYDMSPHLVGKEGVVETVQFIQGNYSYSIDGILEKRSWYNHDQLEIVSVQTDRGNLESKASKSIQDFMPHSHRMKIHPLITTYELDLRQKAHAIKCAIIHWTGILDNLKEQKTELLNADGLFTYMLDNKFIPEANAVLEILQEKFNALVSEVSQIKKSI